MLEIRGLSARIGGREILRDISLTLPDGTLTALVGRNGCGKSTLLSCVAAQRAHSGAVLLGDGAELSALPPRKRAQRLALLPQDLSAPHMTVRELAELGRSPYVDVGRRLTGRDHEAVRRALERAEAVSLADRFLDEISGGERQRAYLAMILAQETELLLLDEPVTHLDLTAGEDFLRLLVSLQEEGHTILVVLHDLAQAVHFADRMAVMDGGRIAFVGGTADCLASGVLERTLSVRRYTAQGRSFFASDRP